MELELARLFEAQKLPLLLDLDDTLFIAQSSQKVAHVEGNLPIVNFRADGRLQDRRIRASVRAFLNKVKPGYQVSAITAAIPSYARAMVYKAHEIDWGFTPPESWVPELRENYDARKKNGAIKREWYECCFESRGGDHKTVSSEGLMCAFRAIAAQDQRAPGRKNLCDQARRYLRNLL